MFGLLLFVGLGILLMGVAILLTSRLKPNAHLMVGVSFIVVGVLFAGLGVSADFISGGIKATAFMKGTNAYRAGDYRETIRILEPAMEDRMTVGKLDVALLLSKSYGKLGNREKEQEYYLLAGKLFDNEKAYLTRFYVDLDDYWNKSIARKDTKAVGH